MGVEKKEKILVKFEDMIKKDEIQSQIHEMESLKGDTEDDRSRKPRDEENLDAEKELEINE